MILLPVFAGTGIVGLMEDNDYPDDDAAGVIFHFPANWVRIQTHQLSVLLKIAISIFALFVVYLGGRSKNRRFNDRTYDPIKPSFAVFSKTTLNRVVFCFLLFSNCLDQRNDRFTTFRRY
jgi:hypothetical protein